MYLFQNREQHRLTVLLNVNQLVITYCYLKDIKLASKIICSNDLAQNEGTTSVKFYNLQVHVTILSTLNFQAAFNNI